jgi:hypothetical protein
MIPIAEVSHRDPVRPLVMMSLSYTYLRCYYVKTQLLMLKAIQHPYMLVAFVGVLVHMDDAPGGTLLTRSLVGSWQTSEAVTRPIHH